MIHPRVTRTQSTHYHPLSPETRAMAPAPGYWLLIVTPHPPPLLFVKMDCFLVNECCVHYVELNPMSNISKSCETHEKLWKFCERLDLLVKKMVRGRFADIWEDLMGFLENRFTWCFGCCSTDKHAREMEQENLYLLNHFRSFYRFGHVSPYYNHIKTLAASDVNTWI